MDTCTLGRQDHHWPAARAAVLERDGHRCRFCGAIDNLEVHHLTPVTDYRDGCQHHRSGLILLDKSCHARDHAFLRSGRRWYQPTLALAA